jgi:hypothetical protein
MKSHFYSTFTITHFSEDLEGVVDLRSTSLTGGTTVVTLLIYCFTISISRRMGVEGACDGCGSFMTSFLCKKCLEKRLGQRALS